MFSLIKKIDSFLEGNKFTAFFVNRDNFALVLIHVEGKRVVELANMPLSQYSKKTDEVAIIELGARRIQLTKKLFNGNEAVEF